MIRLITASLLSDRPTPADPLQQTRVPVSRAADSRLECQGAPHHTSLRSAVSSLLMVLSLAWTAIVVPGCSQLDINPLDFSFNKDDEPGTPTRMIPVWTDTVLTRVGQPGVRGFGGRIVFYEDAQQQPIHVDGSLVIYAWDDTDADALDKVPDRKYVITADKLASHFSTSRIGASYSIWIPWDEAGGAHRKVTLITRFVGSNGAEVVSQPMDAVLPGPTGDHILVEQSTSPARGPVSLAAVPEPMDQDTPPGSAAGTVQPVSWQSGVTHAAGSAGQPRMTTTTFDVSPAFAARHFGDNSAPLRVDVARFGHQQASGDEQRSEYGQLSGSDQQRANDDAERAADDARLAAQRVTESPSVTDSPAPSAHSAPTPPRAQTGRPARPTPSPLRSRPRRATWRPRRTATR